MLHHMSNSLLLWVLPSACRVRFNPPAGPRCCSCAVVAATVTTPATVVVASAATVGVLAAVIAVGVAATSCAAVLCVLLTVIRVWGVPTDQTVSSPSPAAYFR